MLDRSHVRDDRRGLGEPLLDNQPTPFKFSLQLETLSSSFDVDVDAVLPSMNANLVGNTMLQLPISVLSSRHDSDTSVDLEVLPPLSLIPSVVQQRDEKPSYYCSFPGCEIVEWRRVIYDRKVSPTSVLVLLSRPLQVCFCYLKVKHTTMLCNVCVYV
eukprot:m.92909 g.92909  ORF g.92909 m.92909 type:complete len:158 (-) comp12373_c0_seq9:914-1387(-)